MRYSGPAWLAVPPNQKRSLSVVSVPIASRRWAGVSICSNALAILLFILVFFCRVPDGHFNGDPGYSRARLFCELSWESLLLLAYITGRLGWKTVIGKVGAVASIPLLFFDVMAFLPTTLSQLAAVSP